MLKIETTSNNSMQILTGPVPQLALADGQKNFKDILSREVTGGIPTWVNNHYEYDAENPRKPNIAELMEKISSSNLASLYGNSPPSKNDIFHLATDILYGVVPSASDSRDWEYIMSSKNVVIEAARATNAMYEPKLRTEDIFDAHGVQTGQDIQLVSEDNKVLRSLGGQIDYIEQSMRNFGLEKVDPKLFSQLRTEYHDPLLIEFLKGYQGYVLNNTDNLEKFL